MARIRLYEPGSAPSGTVGGANASAASFGGLAGAALGAAGTQLNKIAAAVRKKEDQQNQLWADKTAADARNFWVEESARLEKDAEPGAPGYVENLRQRYEEKTSELLGAAPSPSARDRLALKLSNLRATVISGGLQFQAVEHGRKMVADATDMLNASVNAIAADPSQYEAAHAETMGALGDLDIDEINRRKLMDTYDSMSAKARFLGLIDNASTIGQLKTLREEVESETWTARLNPNDMQSLLGDIDRTERAIETQNTVNKALARSLLAMDSASADRGVPLNPQLNAEMEGLIARLGDSVLVQRMQTNAAVRAAVPVINDMSTAQLTGYVEILNERLRTSGGDPATLRVLDTVEQALRGSIADDKAAMAEISSVTALELDKMFALEEEGLLRPDDPRLRGIAVLASRSNKATQQRAERLFSMIEGAELVTSAGSTEDAIRVVDELKLQAAAGNEDAAVVGAARSALDARVEAAISGKTMDWARDNPNSFLGPAPPLDLSSPESFTESLSNISAFSAKVNAFLGAVPDEAQFFDSTQAALLEDRLRSATTDEKLAFARAMVGGISDPDMRAIAVDQLAENNPFMSYGIGMVVARPSMEANFRLAMRGNATLKENPAMLGSTLKRDMQQQAAAILNDVVSEAPEGSLKNIVETATGIYIAQQGSMENLQEDLWEESIGMAVGRMNGMGGVGTLNGRRFALPIGVSERAFSVQLRAMTPEDLAQRGGGPPMALSGEISGEDIWRNGRMVTFGVGVYGVAFPDGRMMTRPDGTPWVIDFRDMTPTSGRVDPVFDTAVPPA